jgi:hypothetical protein
MATRGLLLLVWWLALGCTRASGPADAGPARLTADEVRQRFEEGMRSWGHSLTPVDAGLYSVFLDGGSPLMLVYIGNLQKNAVRDDDRAAIPAFVSRVSSVRRKLPWNEAREQLFAKLEPRGYDFHGAPHRPVTPRADRMLILLTPNGDVRWVMKEMLDEWGVTWAEAERVAGENLDRLLAGVRPEIEETQGHRVGMVPIAEPLKASMILAPHFRQFVESELGWPVLVTTPCRDFVLLYDAVSVARGSAALVREEYSSSGYPITTELMRLSDAGLEVVEDFAPPHVAGDGHP